MGYNVRSTELQKDTSIAGQKDEEKKDRYEEDTNSDKQIE